MMDKVGAETLKRMDTARFYNDVIFHRAEKLLKGDILEVGCGIGSFTKKLATKGNVTSIDIERLYINKTKKALRDNASVGYGDIEKGVYFFDNNKKFDSIVCLNVLEHIKNDDKALLNMYSLLKKGGNIFLLTPAHPFFYGSLDKNLGHERRYKIQHLVKLFVKSHFKIQRSYYFNLLGGLGWFINSRIFKRQIIPSNQLWAFVLFSRIPLFLENFFVPPFGLSCIVIASK